MNEVVSIFEASRSQVGRRARSEMQSGRLNGTAANTLTLDECADVGLQIAKQLCGDAEEVGGGKAWRSVGGVDGLARYAPDLYGGAAGIGLALAAAFPPTGDGRLAGAAEGAARWLASSEWGYGSACCGLHAGEGGVGLFYLRLASLLKTPAYIDMAILRARRLEGVEPVTIDLVDGIAGWLVFLTELEEATSDRRFHRMAVRLGNSLLKLAVPQPDNDGIYWEVPKSLASGPSQPYLGLRHGAAGIGLALLKAGTQLRVSRFVHAAMQVGLLLETTAIETVEDGQLVYHWSRTLDRSGRRFAAHCHGSGGIGQFLIRLWKQTHSAETLTAAHYAAAAVASRDPRDPSQCHGLAGDGALFLDMFQATGDERFRHLAFDVAERLREYQGTGSPYVGRRSLKEVRTADYMTGLAGIAAFYGRFAHGQRDLVLP